MSSDALDKLSDCISRAIQEHFASSQWPLLDSLSKPVIRFEAFLQDGDAAGAQRLLSHSLDLSQAKTPVAQLSPEAIAGKAYQDGFDATNLTRHAEETSTHVHQPSSALPSPPFLEPGTDSKRCNSSEEDEGSDSDASGVSRRKATGGLRLARGQNASTTISVETQRQLQSDNRNFPKRRKIRSDDSHSPQPSSLDKLIVGIWEQIHGSIHLDPSSIIDQIRLPITENGGQPPPSLSVTRIGNSSEIIPDNVMRVDDSFSRMNIFCRKVTQASRACRSIELIVQAYWVEQFDERISMLAQSNPSVSFAKHKKSTMMQACQDFEWTEKELRNKMAIWRGYKEVKDAGGWAALVFAGMGLYRFCKYRIGFDKEALRRLRQVRPRLEVAADTLHPNWRQLLSIIGQPCDRVYQGHPHDWVVTLDGADPVPLRMTYLQWDPYFNFEHLEDSVIDNDAWGCDDPRWIPPSNSARATGKHICEACGEEQSDDPKQNSCYCFPTLYGGGKRNPAPVQVYQTADGRNNGLLACCPFDRGAAIGEFTGLVTRNLQNLDVMDSSTPAASYQIWQGRQGNYTRFVNHSCKANAQFQRFAWLDTQRVILVSKGIEAGTEITADYSDRYWGGLDKKCLCGEPCCRYKAAESRPAG